ncbi:hypothetical protein Anas_03289 [Armadillidium nasatum]|uniref:Uncharacterized protein n=1 Tax=Armadillidium nasatum TaxID=96803 RepID=A0A5N5TL24_9CRUS|nr:hypothetical protein Anas_03289 [Armadillidium nasatum]
MFWSEFVPFVERVESSNAAESRSCPGVGRYEVLPGTNSLPGGGSYPPLGRESMELPLGACAEELFTALTVGCSSSDTLEIHTSCSSSEYSCHGWWEEAGRQYLVVTPTSRSSKGVRRLCLVLDTGGTGSGALSLASSAQSCSRELTPGMHGRIALNTTSSGGCEALTASGAMSSSLRVSPSGIVLMFAINVHGIAYLMTLRDAYVRRFYYF